MPNLCIRVRDEKYHIQMNILTFVRIIEICTGENADQPQPIDRLSPIMYQTKICEIVSIYQFLTVY